MKRAKHLLALLLVLTVLLSGCSLSGSTPTQPTQPLPSTPTDPAPTDTQPTEPAQTQPTEPEDTQPTEPEGELFSVKREGHYVFDTPSFDGAAVQGLPAGVYTIVDRAQDDEGYDWGKLKSGMGWICLSEIQQAQEAALPIAIVEAYPELLKGENADSFELFPGEYCWKVAVFAYEKLTDVKLSLLNVFDEEPQGELKWEQESLTPERPVVLQLAFPGDFTTYELTFLDASGEARIFRIMQSGRNGLIYTLEVE